MSRLCVRKTQTFRLAENKHTLSVGWLSPAGIVNVCLVSLFISIIDFVFRIDY